MLKLSLLLVVLCGGVVNGNWKEILPWGVKSTLLDLHIDYNILSIKDNPVPIYRKDLDVNYPAYWLVELNEGEFMILSTGPETGDYRMVFKGDYSPLISLDKAAEKNGSHCVKYFMLSPTPGFFLACEDGNGKLVASGREIQVDMDNLKTIWYNQNKEVIKDEIWSLSTLYKDEKYTHYHLLKPGDSKHIMLGNYDTGDIETREIKNGNSQEVVCKIFDVCLKDNIYRIDPKKVSETSYGQRYLNLDVPHGVNQDVDHGTLYMEISTRAESSIQTTKVAVDLVNRVKRAVPINKSASIEDEVFFPDYNQHFIEKCSKFLFWKRCKNCAVGCGPVSWAMIFGFYDRRSHRNPSKYGTGSQTLFTCGKTGIFGDRSCEAPERDTLVTEKYIKELGQYLGTFCLFGQGATKQGDMQKIERYFTVSQMSGDPEVITHSNGFLSFIGNYNRGIRDKAMSYIEEGWPVVVGMRTDVTILGITFKEFRFGQHYPVATRYKQRAYPSTKCKGWFKNRDCEDGLLVEREFYVHWGWGLDYQSYNPSKNWIPARIFFAGVAKY